MEIYEALIKIVKDEGRDAVRDGRRVSAIVSDLCSGDAMEGHRHLLKVALELGVATELLRGQPSAAEEARLQQMLVTRRFLSPDAAATVVGWLMSALGYGSSGGTAASPSAQPAQSVVSIMGAEAVAPPTPGKDFIIPDLGMDMVWVAPGTFMMGSESGRENEKPIHEVTLTRVYWLGRYPVTQAEWVAIMKSNPSEFKGDERPVECVDWSSCVEFCGRLNKRERSANRLPAGYNYELPTEAQWEFAARGGTQSRRFIYSGSNQPNAVAWHEGTKETKEVGLLQGNELGIHDMSGNVWEWCADWHGDYPSGRVTDSEGTTTGSTRVCRGGSWYCVAGSCRLAFRHNLDPSDAFSSLGFRLALHPVQ
ncbi:MAG: formylglycine-generating enzyme family protein [Spartobacteria bacterium]|nr:formylglycine-generating enzyme family protein [Spartobacteria bacterium]